MQYDYVLMSMQSVDHQDIYALVSSGGLKQNILVDCIADKTSERPAFKQLIGKLTLGDTLTIGSLHQLGTDLSAIPNAWQRIARTQKVEIRVLDMESSTPLPGDEMRSTINSLSPKLFNYLYKTESHYRKQRQAEDIAQSLVQGNKFGSKPKERPSGYRDMYEAWRRKRVTEREAARKPNVAHGLFIKWVIMDMAREGKQRPMISLRSAEDAGDAVKVAS